jgi:hypothetical protein
MKKDLLIEAKANMITDILTQRSRKKCVMILSQETKACIFERELAME